VFSVRFDLCVLSLCESAVGGAVGGCRAGDGIGDSTKHTAILVYFGEGVIDYRYYGIPCKPLPTPDAMWSGEFAEVPPAIDGPVLISAGCLSGWEFGPGPLNPYEQFESLKPTAVIDYGVFVYDGHFQIPLAASLSDSHKARVFLAANQLPEALAEAQQALTLAPKCRKTQCAARRYLHRDESTDSSTRAL